ncbi:TcmI family type II polyketide cyclase [Streptomyces sp. NPDC001668]|uniref:TcmI family type II polyketide cyclase n=1 Tax=unclassified Streptomyces TaxID=2593676 RepID=UPI003679A35D
MQRVMFIDRMRPEDAEKVSAVWEAHDRTGLPRRIGVATRTLYRFRGLYVHMVEARPDLEGDLADRILSARTDPLFVETRDRLADYLSPFSPECRTVADTRAEEFYHWRES